MPIQRSISNDAITTHLKNLLEQNVDILRILWKDYNDGGAINDNKGKAYKVYTALQTQLPYTPAIELIALTKQTNIFSIGTQEDLFPYDIVISIEQAHPENSDRWLKVFAPAVQDLLNAFENRSFQVPGYDFCCYFSEAVDLNYGFRRGAGLLSAKISWSCKLLKPNRGI